MTLAMLLSVISCSKKYAYETVPGDPLNTRIYTLDNGLKVYLTRNTESPRIQTLIPVRVGGKNDPAETTGLAHYFEHLMFKGTNHFGTSNWEAEEPMLDEIERLFEIYRKTTDETERTAIYHQIDSISYAASEYFIPNEYDKLMASIGAEGTNAYTSYDVTCFTEDIPSNQIENWARVQSDRFQNAVIRGFHTELETVYEEKNMSLTSDQERAQDALLNILFKNHPYGTQTILGSQDNLKNPSITNIKKYYEYWYRSNNIAICMSGDLDFDKTMAIIDKYFGGMQPNDELKRPEFAPEKPLTEPQQADVTGLEAEMVYIGWRIPGQCDADSTTLASMASRVLYNGAAGLIDINVNNKQKVLAGGAGVFGLTDRDIFVLMGYPKDGQTLEEVKDILLEQVANLRDGKFSDNLIPATVANTKLSQQRSLENNRSRATMLVNSFVNGVEWKDQVRQFQMLDSIDKADITAFANKYLADNNYAIVYKHQGQPNDFKKIDKPQITPIRTNRDTSSVFMREIQNSQVKPIEPVFVDFDKSVLKTKVEGMDMLYTKNDINDIFRLSFQFNRGDASDKLLDIASDYIDYLGTPDMTSDQIQEAFYDLACSYNIGVSNDITTITVTGLAENITKAVELMEKVIYNAVSDEDILNGVKADILKFRAMSKADQDACFDALTSYLYYGEKNPANQILSERDLVNLDGNTVLAHLRDLMGCQHRIMYYGPATMDDAVAAISSCHKVADNPQPLEYRLSYPYRKTSGDTIYLAPYDANQIYMMGYFSDGDKFDPRKAAIVTMYNNYFGSGMNAIVFQEMREARGLAYSASAAYSSPANKEDSYLFRQYIATQNDKTVDAINAFNEITNQMPVSEKAFDIAKSGLISSMRSERTKASGLIGAYLQAERRGIDYDLNKAIYEGIQDITLDDVVKFQQEYIRNHSINRAILGRENDLDMKNISKYGPVRHLTLEEIFGY